MKLRSKSTHSQHTCRKTIHKQTRRKRSKRTNKGDARKATKQEGTREKRQSKRKVRRPQSAHLSKKIVFVMVLRIILSDFASEGEGATGASRTVLRGFRSPRQIRFRHRRGSRHREILDHRDVHRRDDSDHREQRDV